MFYYLARGAALATNSSRYLSGLKALTGVTATNDFNGTLTITGITVTAIHPTTNGTIYIICTTNDHAGGIYDMLSQFGYPAPILQSSPAQTPGQMNAWLRKDVPGLNYSLQSRSDFLSATWQPASPSVLESNTLWSAGISVPPGAGSGFYRVSTAPTPTSAAVWP
jgi:hypothetical protein